MSRLGLEARMTIKTLNAKTTNSAIARLLDVSEGAVRYHVGRMAADAVDGRSRQTFKADAFAEAIELWRSEHTGPLNLGVLHEWLRAEHGYDGSVRSVQRYWRRRYPAPAIRARRRVETPAGAQAQVDWAAFPGVIIDGAPVDLLAMVMVLSFSRKQAIVWSVGKDTLSWLTCHSACLTRLGGVPATLRIDNERTAISRGAGCWGTINATYRRYALMMRFHIDACAPRQPQQKGKVERRVRDQRFAINPYGDNRFTDMAALQAWTDDRIEELSHKRRCPTTGTTVAEAWAQEIIGLTPLPETLPDPFDAVATRTVGIDCLVAFEGRQYSVPFRFVGQEVEVRGAAASVQILKACEMVAVHPRRTQALLVIDQAHYNGPSTERVMPPPPLGRMGTRIQELANTAVAHRSIDLYAALAEVAR
jgi:hypothetical protein